MSLKDNDVNVKTFTMALLDITNAFLLVFNFPREKKPYQKNVNASTYLKHCTVTFNLNRRTARLRPLLLRNPPFHVAPLSTWASASCSCVSESFSRMATAIRSLETTSQVSNDLDTICVLWDLQLNHSHCHHSTIAGCHEGTLGSPDTESTGRVSGLRVRTP